MKTLIICLFMALINTAYAASHYSGRVGNSKVDATLTYYSDKTASGYYVSRASGKVYLLKGNNRIEGRLFLVEYTKSSNGNWYATSNSYLYKSKENGKVVWSGVMKNYDGRNVSVRLVKK